SRDRVVRPFEWGLDWLPPNGHDAPHPPVETLRAWVAEVMADTGAFFTPPPTTEYHEETSTDGETLVTFPSALRTPHAANNLVSCRFFPAARRTPAAVLVLPQWNSDAGGHVGLCRLLSWNGLSALRLSLPYHDRRMPPELTRADYIVSSN